MAAMGNLAAYLSRQIWGQVARACGASIRSSTNPQMAHLGTVPLRRRCRRSSTHKMTRGSVVCWRASLTSLVL